MLGDPISGSRASRSAQRHQRVMHLTLVNAAVADLKLKLRPQPGNVAVLTTILPEFIVVVVMAGATIAEPLQDDSVAYA
jgi:hypothetical protein